MTKIPQEDIVGHRYFPTVFFGHYGDWGAAQSHGWQNPKELRAGIMKIMCFPSDA
ncbi:hypothetical protein [Sphingomonas sp. TDK1]|uniref:hypothetical protein n=1 Tax=Sphingomonas sp. TDK1 TaxID=453247 RepID=UPI001E2B5DE6|nr:hypothetical protein [Sphingomonas sp. TDK1]